MGKKTTTIVELSEEAHVLVLEYQAAYKKMYGKHYAKKDLAPILVDHGIDSARKSLEKLLSEYEKNKVDGK